jgi:glutamyl-Q tRNA(Asp) synthetase
MRMYRGGEWLVRMEDIDAPRNVPGAADDILRTLEAFGFEWDGSVLFQSTRLDAYVAALERLKRDGLAYGCACSRKEVADSATHAAIDGGLAYPGTCRAGLPAGRAVRAWRLRVDDEEVAFEDRLQGLVAQRLDYDVGDFVLLRADGQFAYQLAVTVDDEFQGISSVVRGADLLASTPRQICLAAQPGLFDPRVYAHLPVAANAGGRKALQADLGGKPLQTDRASRRTGSRRSAFSDSRYPANWQKRQRRRRLGLGEAPTGPLPPIPRGPRLSSFRPEYPELCQCRWP